MVGERREDYLSFFVQFEAVLGCDDAVEAFRISMMDFHDSG
jgi:hypothetical protein